MVDQDVEPSLDGAPKHNHSNLPYKSRDYQALLELMCSPLKL